MLGTATVPYFRPQSYYDSAAWRGTWSLDGGGALMNQGIHLLIVQDFVAAIREGRDPLVNGVEGRRSLALVLAIYEAAGLGGEKLAFA